MATVLHTIKKYIPQNIFRLLQPIYHFCFNFLAAMRYGFPSRKMIVVGVTGTTGKTTSVFLLAHLLRSAGMRVGYTSTALLSDGKHDWLNDKKMTMLGRFFTQKMLAQMHNNHCDIAIVETTSEGIVQFRHRFINYDIVLFTGIYPEHIESHGSFENYKAEKLKLFYHLAQCRRKKGLQERKVIIVNSDDKYAQEFLVPDVDIKIGFTHESSCVNQVDRCHIYKYTTSNDIGVQMIFDGREMQTPLLGEFSAANVAGVISVAWELGISQDKIVDGVRTLKDVPGRMERITMPRGYEVIVDYAFEPVAMTQLYATVAHLSPRKIIHVLGGTGGGRDRARRPKIGHIAGVNADYIIVTDEDPYDEDPREIMHDVAEGVIQAGKVLKKDFVIIEDRADAIREALRHAQSGDIVLITGKGCEQAICIKNGMHKKHDDRAVVWEVKKEELIALEEIDV